MHAEADALVASARDGGPSNRTVPFSTTTRSRSFATAESSCETSSTPAPWSRIRWTSESRNRRCDSASTPAIGSSSTSSSGSLANARAMKARCCCPPESSFTGRSANSASPTDSSACRAASRSSLRERAPPPAPREPAGRDDLLDRRRHLRAEDRTLRHVARAASDPDAPAGGAPKSRTSPAAGVERAEQQLAGASTCRSRSDRRARRTLPGRRGGRRPRGRAPARRRTTTPLASQQRAPASRDGAT